jgi:hypothetical protein
MEASELMHGDWIRRRWITKPFGTEVVKDFQVDQLRRLHTTDEVLYVYSKNGNMGRVEQMEPIRLTEEILEKNGFEKNNDEYQCKEDDCCLTFSAHQYGLYFSCARPYQRYAGICVWVHQLQHALKLLKIEKEIEL